MTTKVRYVIDPKYNILSMFDPERGQYWRINNQRGQSDAFRASFPHLIDVGIMGHCAHGKSGLCKASGVECYQDGEHIDEPNMSIDNFKRIAEECRGKVFQFALGGRGDVDEHENFEDILKICKDNDIIPNFTTSGYAMNAEKAFITSQYCGAAAVSWYGNAYTLKAIRYLLDAEVKTNIHYVLSNNSIDEALYLLENRRFPLSVNAIIFLLHKPIGLGTSENVLKNSDERVRRFFKQVAQSDMPWKVGFDSCSVPGFVSNGFTIDLALAETCEGARYSCYITSDMRLLPCSFDQQENWAVDISSTSIAEAWESEEFDAFRREFLNACPDCVDYSFCMGGCPICRDIVLCDREERENQSEREYS